MLRNHYRTCHLCEAMCGVVIGVEGRKVHDVRADPDDPFSRGHICPKALALKDVHEDPNRLTEPLIRQDGVLRPATWDEAFDRAVQGLRAVQKSHGRSAVGVYQGNPVVHSFGSLLYSVLFVQTLRTPNHFSATSLDQLPHMLAGYQMFGHQLLLPIPDLDRTDLLIIQGGNPLVSNGSIMSAGDVRGRLRAIKDRGGRIIVIDPRRSQTAKYADEHLFIRPGTDALLLAAVVRHVLDVYGPKLRGVEDFTDGTEQLATLLAPFTPDAVAEATSISAEQIRKLACDFAEAGSAAWYGRIGVCTQEFGGLCGWLLNVVNIITGNLDRPGGVMFPTPAVDLVEIANRLGRKGSFNRRQSRVRGLPEFGGEYPSSALAEEIDTPGEGQIRALITSAGNPVLSSPDGARLDRALDGLDFMVSVDIYVNETTRHADVILPPTFGLERSHFDLAFHLLAVRNSVKYSPPAFERLAEQRHDWEIFLELFTRMRKKGRIGELAAPLERLALTRLTPEFLLDLGLRYGPYGDGHLPIGEGLKLDVVRESLHGIDLGPLQARLPDRLQTKDKRINLVPELYVPDLERLRQRLSRSAPAATSLSLIGRRELRSNNSWMHNSPQLMKGKERCTLHMHPDDAGARGLSPGSQVRVRSEVGEVVVPLEVTDDVMPGVVSLPHGYGHRREGVRLDVARDHGGASANDLTNPAQIDPLSGNARFSDVAVTVHRA